MSPPIRPVTVAALYKFTRLADPDALRAPLAVLCKAQGIKGTLLLAREGLNGTIAGSDQGIAVVLDCLRTLPGCASLDVKLSCAEAMPFYRMKVRVKPEIVTMGQPEIDPLIDAGHYVEPAEWNALISAPGVVLIDTRNDYEVAIGTFAGATDPQTTSFRDFPAWFRAERERLLGQGQTPKVAMFCTGGIRCEKSTAFLKSEGVDEVFHLRGGILKYLEQVPAAESLWQGECFVFDERVSVGHGLAPGSYQLCRACRRPLSAADRASPQYEEGASCPACHDTRDEAQRARYRERHRQERLAITRGTAHLGAQPKEI